MALDVTLCEVPWQFGCWRRGGRTLSSVMRHRSVSSPSCFAVGLAFVLSWPVWGGLFVLASKVVTLPSWTVPIIALPTWIAVGTGLVLLFSWVEDRLWP